MNGDIISFYDSVSANAPILSNIDDDPYLEPMSITKNGYFKIFPDFVTGSGVTLNKFLPLDGAANPTIADITGDNIPDIILPTYRGLFIFNLDGTSILQGGEYFGRGTDGRILADVDNDGNYEYGYGDYFGKVHLYPLNSSISRYSWLEDNSDRWNTNNTTDRVPPLPPSEFSVIPERIDSVNWRFNLSWARNNKEIDFSNYNVYGNFGFIDATAENFYKADLPYSPRNMFYYYVRSVDKNKNISSRSNIVKLVHPIASSDISFATGTNNQRKIAFYQENVYFVYQADNKIYFLSSDDNGENWGMPEIIGYGEYPCICVNKDNKIVAVWKTDSNQLMYSYKEVEWSSPIILPLPFSNLLFLSPPSIAINDTIVHIFISGIYKTPFPDFWLQTWYYGKFSINYPEPQWTMIDKKSWGEIPEPYILQSPSIALKDDEPLLSYDKIISGKNGEIFYAQKINDEWRKWNISNSEVSSFSPSIDFSNGYVNVVWPEGYNGTTRLKCVSIIPSNDTILHYEEMKFREYIKDVSEPYVITNKFIFWKDNQENKIKVVKFNEKSFIWDEVYTISDTVQWYGDVFSPQGVFYRPWTSDSNFYLRKRFISLWSGGIEPDVGIQEIDLWIYDSMHTFANLGGCETSPYTIQRQGFIDYSNGTDEPVKKVDYHPEELIYKIGNLNPKFDYKIRLGLYQKSDKRWKERIEIDQTPIGEKWLYPDEVLWIEKKIPDVDIHDGKIEIRIKKKKGKYAVCGVLYLYEFTKEAGGTSKEFILFNNEKFYIRPIISGIEMNILDEMNVSLKIYDITGRCVYIPIKNKMMKGENKIYLKELPSGIYFYNVDAGGKEYKGKIINVR